VGLEIWRYPGIYTDLEAKFFVGGCRTSSLFQPLSPDNNASHQTVEVRSKHGLILDCSLQLTNMRLTNTTFELLNQWARSYYQGKRYGFLHETADPPGGLHLLRCERNEPILDVKGWLEDALKCNFDGSS
jgi:hypothetical protein